MAFYILQTRRKYTHTSCPRYIHPHEISLILDVFAYSRGFENKLETREILVSSSNSKRIINNQQRVSLSYLENNNNMFANIKNYCKSSYRYFLSGSQFQINASQTRLKTFSFLLLILRRCGRNNSVSVPNRRASTRACFVRIDQEKRKRCFFDGCASCYFRRDTLGQ